ncbi:aspartate carbamoyltransferase catalytic subunit [Candidatus Contubernalis alkalaceticus]|uniref:aspartate carbamoyltransferase catalytic subunit n=1 Tax=Candidatus Contubernalis alkaliaceticus TaxID=338645 RepID=UPI0029624FEA|nr:aspartate carbamoyltransferase catalytic subunit [Candidatus Contubernalis alkalaceticus]
MQCETGSSITARNVTGSEFIEKDLLGIRDLKKEIIELILKKAEGYKKAFQENLEFPPLLTGKTVVNLFFENSTRTRMSFEKAAVNLGAVVMNFDSGTSSVKKGETLVDTVRTVESLGVEGIILRHSLAGSPVMAGNAVKIPVINAGDGCHEHPSQALLDLFTIQEIKGGIAGLKVLFVGDILHSRVVRSNLWALLKLGAEVTVVGPFTLLPPGLWDMGVKISWDLESCLEEAEVIYMLRLQRERQEKGYFPSIGEYRKYFALTAERAENISPSAVIMHPGPVFPGLEIDHSLMDDPRCLIQEQVKNGVFVRMALLDLWVAREVN